MTDIVGVLTRSVQDTPSAPVASKQNGDGDQDHFSRALDAAGGSAQKQPGKNKTDDDGDTKQAQSADAADDGKAPLQDKPKASAGAFTSAYSKLAALTQDQLVANGAGAAAAQDPATAAAATTADAAVTTDEATTGSAMAVMPQTDETTVETAVAEDNPLAALLALKTSGQATTATATKGKDGDDAEDAGDAADTSESAAAGLKATDLLQMLAAGPLAAAAAAQAQQPVAAKTGDTAQVQTTSAANTVADIAGLVAKNADAQADTVSLATDTMAQPADVPDDTQLFRLQKTGAAQSVDIALKTASDGTAETSTDKPAQVTPDVVEVLDSRRFLGLAQTGNTGMLVAAMSGDKDWAGAMSGASSINLLDDGLAPTNNVVHTLKLQLNPDNLGTVTASMRLVGDNLSIHLTVHNSAAYRELTSGSSSMIEGLRSQGFSVDNISVSIASSSDGASSNANGNNSGTQNGSGQQQSASMGQQGQQQNQQAWQQRGTGDGNGQQQGRWTGGNGSQTEGRNEGVGEAVAGNSAASGSVYL
jgi:chemotaxis protein MotD